MASICLLINIHELLLLQFFLLFASSHEFLLMNCSITVIYNFKNSYIPATVFQIWGKNDDHDGYQIYASNFSLMSTNHSVKEASTD